LAMFPK